MKQIHSLLPLAAACLLAASGGTTVAGTITGHVFGANGRPTAAADVHIYPAGRGIGSKPLASAQVGRDGSFTIDMPKGEFFTLVATGADHNFASVIVPGGSERERIGLDVTLPRLPYTSVIDTVRVVGSWNEFDFGTAATMQRLPDGTYLYEVEAPAGQKEVSFQLLGIIGEGSGRFGRSVNAPGGSRYDYDGGGDYRTVVPVVNGRARITFSPSALDRTGTTEPRFAYDRAHDWMNRIVAFNAVQKRVDEVTAERSAALMPILKRSVEQNAPLDINAVKETTERYRTALAEAMKPLRNGLRDRNARVKMFAAIKLAEQPELDPTLVKEISTILPVDDKRWALNPQAQWRLRTWLTKLESSSATTLRNEAWRTGAFRSLSKSTLELWGTPGAEEIEALVGRLIPAFSAEIAAPENGDLAYGIRRFDPSRAIKAGKMVPDFTVKLLDGTTVSRASMMGKTYMIDFWAVWCGPCRGELPGLHAAYEKFKARGFEVLSLSFDEKVADIEKFRLGPKTPMPWMHSFVEGGFGSSLAKAFEVEGIPKPILVGPDGKILASEDQLRGAELATTLERFLPADRAER